MGLPNGSSEDVGEKNDANIVVESGVDAAAHAGGVEDGYAERDIHLKRALNARVVAMLAITGCIGTGLFRQSRPLTLSSPTLTP